MKTLRIYNLQEKLQIIQEFYSSGLSMRSFSDKKGLGHSTLSEWIANFTPTNSTLKPTIMKDICIKSDREKDLEKEIQLLREQLEREKLRSLLYDKMIDIAERDLHIDIRKKSGAK